MQDQLFKTLIKMIKYSIFHEAAGRLSGWFSLFINAPKPTNYQ